MSSTAQQSFRLTFLIAFAIALGAPAPGGQAWGAADATVAAVGDMGCSQWDVDYNNGNGTATHCRQRYVSDLLVNPAPAALLDLGDNQYVDGELANYQAVYHPTFGRANDVVYPSLGNAEYDTPGAQGYFDYFSSVGVTSRITGSGADASNFANGYYSFNIGAWHLIALNSNCAEIVGGCAAGGAQMTWLKADLAAHPNRCTLAYWHHPRWNTGLLGDEPQSDDFWKALYTARADVVLNGHGNHHYERFMPQRPDGTPDAANGIREFIVSTGGESHGTPPTTPGDSVHTTEISDYTSFGVIKLTLHPTSYDWQFVPEVGGSFTDSGSGTCHSAAVTQAPGAPNLSATADNAVHLSWNAPADGGAPITGYKLYRGTTAGGETLLKTLGDVTAYDDASATGGTRYYYRVAAVNSVGEGVQSNEVSATPTAPPPPSATFPSTGVVDNFARAAGPLGPSWRSPGLADAGTVAIQSSGLTKSGSGASSATWNASFGADQEAYLTVLTLPAAGQFVQVAGRVSTLSASTVSCYFLRITPSTGTWDIRKKVNGAASTSLKTFTAPFAAGDGAGLQIVGSAITAYRKPGIGAWTPVGSTTDTAIPGSGYVSFTLGDTTIRGGAFGGGTVAPAAAQPPTAPSLAATADSVVHLGWSAPADGGAPITGYNVYRGASAGGETLLKGLANVTSYDDTAVTAGSKYYYRVAAINSVGEGSQSNEVSATPTAAPPPPLPFPRTPVLDSFARAAGALGVNWQSPGLADPGAVTIQNSGLTKSGAGASSATWSTQTFAADQEAYVTVPTLPSGSSFMQVAGRVSNLTSSTVSCYFLRVTPSTGAWELRKKINGAASTSMKAFSAPFAAGDSLGLQIIGSTITVYRKPGTGAWTSVGSTTDTAIPGAGYVSFTLGDTTMRGGAFGGGSIN